MDGFLQGRREAEALESIPKLHGMKDLQEGEILERKYAQDTLQAVLGLHGYRLVETPILEPTGVFLRKSGGEFASRMYSFREPGGHWVSLRPEFTSSVMRLFLQGEVQQPLPVRWQYAGPVFRYEPESQGSLPQFVQLGAELIGAQGPWADAEVVSMAVEGLIALGLRSLVIRVGDVGCVRTLLAQFNVSERAQMFLLGHLQGLKGPKERLERVEEEAGKLGLLAGHAHSAELHLFAATLETEGNNGGRAGLALSRREQAFSVRTPEEIAARLRRKLASGDEPQRFAKALSFAYELAQLEGEPKATLREAERLLRSHGLEHTSLKAPGAALDALACHNLDEVRLHLDFGLARGIAYYTGLVFEVEAFSEGKTHLLGGGGRYDGLVKGSRGEETVPAVGFAYTLEGVVAVRAGHQEMERPRPARRVLVVPATTKAYTAGLKVARTLRLAGEAAELALEEEELAAFHRYARQKGIESIVVVAESGECERQWIDDASRNPSTSPS